MDKSARKKPTDQSITSLYLTGLENDITESDLRHSFYPFGEIKSILILQKAKSAFINFAERLSAELAMEKLFGRLRVKGHDLKMQWGKKSSTPLPPPSVKSSSHPSQPLTNAPVSEPQMSLEELENLNAAALVATGAPRAYPSMNPSMLGTLEKTYKA